MSCPSLDITGGLYRQLQFSHSLRLLSLKFVISSPSDGQKLLISDLDITGGVENHWSLELPATQLASTIVHSTGMTSYGHHGAAVVAMVVVR